MLRKGFILTAFTLLLHTSSADAQHAPAQAPSTQVSCPIDGGGCQNRQMGLAASGALLLMLLATTAVEKLKL